MTNKEPFINNKTIELTVRAIFAGLIYGVVLLGLGILFAGVGHGPRIYLYLAIAPYGIGLFLWPALGLCLGQMVYKNHFWYLFLILISFHYLLSGGLVAWNWEWETHWRFKQLWSVFNPFFIIYFSGQLVIWGRFIAITIKTN